MTRDQKITMIVKDIIEKLTPEEGYNIVFDALRKKYYASTDELIEREMVDRKLTE